jgi:hypothetical protein
MWKDLGASIYVSAVSLDRDSIVELVKWFFVKLYEVVGNLRAKYAQVRI